MVWFIGSDEGGNDVSFYVEGSIAWLLAIGLVVVGILYLVFRQKRESRVTIPKEIGVSALRVDDTKRAVTASPFQLFDDSVVVERVSEVNDGLVAYILDATRRAARTGKTLQIEINSQGGDVVIARSVASILRHFRKEHMLRIVVTGKCYSAGMTILMAAEPDERYAVEGSGFLVHASRRTANDSRDKLTRQYDAEALEVICAGSRVDRSSLADILKSGKNCLFSAEDARKLGIVGSII